ncbi:MAG TPA: GNAT family N-acetyltransferase [Candidatus Angelobacter sp.]|nr:GNAT family N-acetyltransferase [Candidatus Angelobacter sp.]
MEQGVILETERLVLREFKPEDTDALLAVLGDHVAMQYYPAPFSRAEVADWISRNKARYSDAGFGLWAMLLKGSGELIGDCGIYARDVDGDFEFELGWHVRRDLWRQGYATEAARSCLAHALWKLGAERVIALVRPENISSCRVAEKIGMACDRVIFWRGYDHRVYVKRRVEA